MLHYMKCDRPSAWTGAPAAATREGANGRLHPAALQGTGTAPGLALSTWAQHSPSCSPRKQGCWSPCRREGTRVLHSRNASLFACAGVPPRCPRVPSPSPGAAGSISAGAGHPGPRQIHCSVPHLPPQSGDNDIGASGFVWGRPSPREVVRPVRGCGQHWAQAGWTIGSPRP